MNTHALIFVDSSIDDDNSLTFNGQFIPDYIAKQLQSIPGIDTIHYGIPSQYHGRLQEKSPFVYTTSDNPDFWNTFFSRTEAIHVIKIPADAAFLQGSIISQMLDTHLQYLSEFTFSYNLPSGYACEIISKSALENPLAHPQSNNSLCDIIKGNLNQFDVELFYKEPDIRWHRIQFRAGTIRDRLIMQNIINHTGTIPEYESLQTVIDHNPEVLFTTPSYVTIELCGRCNLDCIFCYRKQLSPNHGDMDFSTLQTILERMRTFSTPYTVCFGGSGEPLLHPQFFKILELCSNEELIHTIVIETNGIYADTAFATTVASLNKKIITIVNINGYNPETYQKLHNADHFGTVHANVIHLNEMLQANHKNNSLYVQIMKINETEPFLDSYYDLFEQHKIPVILQKQNTYTGRITDRRYSDLTPLQRKPCWHLQQDLYIVYDGRVAFCMQDFDGSARRGTIVHDDLKALWEQQKQHFVNDYKQNRATKPDCNSCDEWYTFNL